MTWNTSQKNLKDSLHLNLSCFTLSQFHLPLPSSSCNAVFSNRQEPISRNDSENSESADGVSLENSSTQKKKKKRLPNRVYNNSSYT